jgi:hypothetical protein
VDAKTKPTVTPEVKAAAQKCLETARKLPHRVHLAKRWLMRQSGCQEGAGAHAKCFAIAIALVYGFGLDADEDDAVELLHEWGQKPDQVDRFGMHFPWSYGECAHKISDAIGMEYLKPGDLYLRECDLETKEDEEAVKAMLERKGN